VTAPDETGFRANRTFEIALRRDLRDLIEDGVDPGGGGASPGEALRGDGSAQSAHP
jgi:hypothetical protein